MELIRVHDREYTSGGYIKVVNARELYEFLEIKTDFKDWFPRRVQEYGFVEGKDFCSFLSESNGGRPSSNAELSLDMAKELAMVEKTDKGRQARQYFIECERIAKGSIAVENKDPILAQIEIIQAMRQRQINIEKMIEIQSDVLVATREDVKNLKDNLRVENWQQNNLQSSMKAKIEHIHNLHPKSDVGELYSRAWKLFKQTFKIPRYNELPAMMYEDGMATIDRMTIWSFPGAKR